MDRIPFSFDPWGKEDAPYVDEVLDDPRAERQVPDVVTLADVKPERVNWLWRGRLPLGKLVVLDGDPATGKSTLSLDLAAHISTGQDWPDGADCPTGDVLLLSAEDGLADTIAPRLAAAGANRRRVHALTQVPRRDDDGNVRYEPPSLPRDIALIRGLIEQRKIKLVIVDVLAAYLDGRVDAHRDQDVRGVLHQLAMIADATSATVVLIRHLNKSTGSNALYRGGGSIGIVGAARAGLLVARDPQDDTRRILAPTKSNLAIEPPALAYRLVNDHENGCAQVIWEPGTVNYRASDLLGPPSEDDQRSLDAWLTEFLDQPRDVAEIYQTGDAHGYSKDQLKRAKKRLGVVARKTGMKGGWQWSTCEGSTEGSEGSGNLYPLPSLPSGPEPLSSEPSTPATDDPPQAACRNCGLTPTDKAGLGDGGLCVRCERTIADALLRDLT